LVFSRAARVLASLNDDGAIRRQGALPTPDRLFDQFGLAHVAKDFRRLERKQLNSHSKKLIF
jgi:hypothetical protein